MSGSQRYQKRKRLEACIHGGVPDRAPVALWRHFPVDDQTPEGLASATVDFQRAYDFDFVKVTPASSFCLRAWGVQDEWRGTDEGTRIYTRRAIYSPEDWLRLQPLDPFHGSLGDQLVCLDQIIAAMNTPEEVTPVIQTIFNPLSQAKNLVGSELLLMHVRCYPEAVQAGLKTITESILRFIEAARQTGISGIFYAVQHASYSLLSEEEFSRFSIPYDLQILEAVQDLWLNVLHLHGEQVMFDQVARYPVGVINWHDRDTEPSLGPALERFGGALCGGLQRYHTMVLGNPLRVTAEAHDAIQATEGRRLILGTGCVLPTIAPRANILAARRSVDKV